MDLVCDFQVSKKKKVPLTRINIQQNINLISWVHAARWVEHKKYKRQKIALFCKQSSTKLHTRVQNQSTFREKIHMTTAMTCVGEATPAPQNPLRLT